jgi:hypothetical protein
MASLFFGGKINTASFQHDAKNASGNSVAFLVGALAAKNIGQQSELLVAQLLAAKLHIYKINRPGFWRYWLKNQCVFERIAGGYHRHLGRFRDARHTFEGIFFAVSPDERIAIGDGKYRILLESIGLPEMHYGLAAIHLYLGNIDAAQTIPQHIRVSYLVIMVSIEFYASDFVFFVDDEI